MIKPKCYLCNKELDRAGALMFSPPTSLDKDLDQVNKYHFCPTCYFFAMDSINMIKQLVYRINDEM